MRNIFINGKIVTENEVLEGYKFIVENNKIVEISKYDNLEQKECEKDTNYIDVNGDYIMPGLIDIHSDMIELILQPRSTSMMDFEMGLGEAEKQLAACGITTMFHSVAMYKSDSWDSKEIRSSENVTKLAKLIKQMKSKPHLINNMYHLRYETDNLECLELVKNLINDNCVNLLSLMDHRPGQGQYKDLNVYRRHLPGEGKNFTDEEFMNFVKKEQEKYRVSGDELKEFMELAKQKNIAVASHDDDTITKIDYNNDIGVAIAEFPITLEVAKYAKSLGMYTLLGAPNVLRGKSHSGNLSAIEAVQSGCGDILCSDYYPQALLKSVFTLNEKLGMPLNETCKLATLNPAIATNISKDKGSLEVSKDADFIIVSNTDKFPVLKETWVKGSCTLKTNYILD